MSNDVAMTAKAFKAKYGNMRLTKKTMIKIPLIDYLYSLLYPEAALSDEGKLTLYDRYKNKLKHMDDMEAEKIEREAERYYELASWALWERRTIYEHIEAADNAIFNALKILNSILQGEILRRTAGEYIAQSPEAAEAFTALSILDIDGLLSEDGNGWALLSTYKNVNKHMRYTTVYNGIARAVAEEIDIPEFAQLQANTKHIEDGQALIKNAAETVKEALSYRHDETEAPEDRAEGFMGVNGIYHDKTGALLDEALAKLEPRLYNVEGNAMFFDDVIKRDVLKTIRDIVKGTDDIATLSVTIELYGQKEGKH